MITYTLKGATIRLPVTDVNQYAYLTIEGDRAEQILDLMLSGTGVYGHLFRPFTTAADLDCVLNSGPLEAYSPELIEGLEILDQKLDPGIPAGAIP